jgi:predicted TIM-barrel fold metal-dependent hydrolase
MTFRMGSADGYPIIDADTHITEPPDLWVGHLPGKYRERGPKVIDGPYGGKAWQAPTGRTIPLTRIINTAGVSPTDWEFIPKEGFDALRPGGWDPKERIRDMDIDMVDVHMIFPTYAFMVCESDDRELHIAVTRAYNDWVSEFCSYAPERLFAYAILPITGVDDAIAEATRVRNLPGICALLLRTWPNGSLYAQHSNDDDFWSAAEDLDFGVACHIAFKISGQPDDPQQIMSMLTLPYINQEKLAIDAMPVLSEMILGGALERHPKLRFALVEVGIGWVPFFLEQSNDNYMRHRFWTHAQLSMPPSEYWARQCFATFQVDTYGISNRDRVGINNIMWTSDYPHAGSDWPYARERIEHHLGNVPERERRLILHDNAMRFYGLNDTGSLSARQAQTVAEPATAGRAETKQTVPST